MNFEFFETPYLLTQLITPRQSRALIRAFEKLELTRAQIFRENIGTHYSSRRKARVVSVGDSPAQRKMLRKVLELNRRHWHLRGRFYPSPLQYVVYEKGGRFSWHVDSPHHQLIDKAAKTDRLFTAVLALSDPKEFRGGEFEMYDLFGGIHKINFKPGQMLLFPSDYLHRVQPIGRGARRVLVLWVRGIPLKQQNKKN